MCSECRRARFAHVLPRVPALVNSTGSTAKSVKALLPIYICPSQQRARGKNARLQQAACGKIPPGCTTVTREGPVGLTTALLVQVGHRRSGQGSSEVLSQTNARAMRNAHSLISSIYFYYHLQNYRWYFRFIWESLWSLQTSTRPIWGEFLHAHFTDMECTELILLWKPSLPDFPACVAIFYPRYLTRAARGSSFPTGICYFFGLFTYFAVIGWCFSSASSFCQFQVSIPTPKAFLFFYHC